MSASLPQSGTINLRRGSIVFVELPHSEVLCHMRVAGQVLPVQITGTDYLSAQVLDTAGKPFSFPVTLGEAGIYTDSTGTPYAYPAEDVLCANCGMHGYSAGWSVAIDWRADALCPKCTQSYDWSGDWTSPADGVYLHL
jgi:hypothetical protein